MPWQKIACDLLALGGKYYLLTVNYYSNWVEIGLLRNCTMSSKVITQLTSSFARYGIPDEVIPTTVHSFQARHSNSLPIHSTTVKSQVSTSYWTGKKTI